jgi:hypothetical protein
MNQDFHNINESQNLAFHTIENSKEYNFHHLILNDEAPMLH